MTIKVNVRKYLKEQHDLNNKMLMKLDSDLQNCNTQLTAVKLMVSALEHRITTMKTLYLDLMELRKTIVILHPHLLNVR